MNCSPREILHTHKIYILKISNVHDMQLFVSFYSYKQRPGCNQYTHVSGNTITGHILSHPQGLTNESTLYRGCVTTHIITDCVSDKSLYDPTPIYDMFSLIVCLFIYFSYGYHCAHSRHLKGHSSSHLTFVTIVT